MGRHLQGVKKREGDLNELEAVSRIVVIILRKATENNQDLVE